MATSRDEYIRDFKTQQIMGILRYKPNGDIEAIEFNSRQILGFYRASTDSTTDFLGRIRAKGNCVASFIYEAYHNK